MSTTRETTVWCDGPECGQWVQESGNAAQVRRVARRRGWRHLSGGRDLCPACVLRRDVFGFGDPDRDHDTPVTGDDT